MVEARFLRHYGKPYGLIFGYSDGTTTLYGWSCCPKKQRVIKTDLWVKSLNRLNTKEHWLGELNPLPGAIRDALPKFIDDFELEVKNAGPWNLARNNAAPKFRYWEETLPKKLEQFRGVTK